MLDLTAPKGTNSCHCVRKLLNTPLLVGSCVSSISRQRCLKRYRQANARLAAASLKVEQFICANRWDKIAHNRLPIAAFRLRKALGKSLRSHRPSEHETGNRPTTQFVYLP